eukprot:14782448-Alexandrium_andersonii.AAC.1
MPGEVRSSAPGGPVGNLVRDAVLADAEGDLAWLPRSLDPGAGLIPPRFGQGAPLMYGQQSPGNFRPGRCG